MARSGILALLLVCLAGLSIPASAQISPGKLSSYHKDLEGIKNCTNCHKLGESVLSERCLDCHKSLSERISSQKGYHSQASVVSQTCTKCHSEHHGRDHELVFWENGENSFDHSQTGYELLGAHEKLSCRQCHRISFHQGLDLANDTSLNPQRTKLGLSTACISCHIDEHNDQLTDECLECHSMDAWIPAPRFSHNKTRYPLTGKHQSIECKKCHVLMDTQTPYTKDRINKKERLGKYSSYSNLTFSDCNECHKDPHNGMLSGSCSSCHTTAGFDDVKKDSFEHDMTGYPLRGAHINVACEKCHDQKEPVAAEASKSCSYCHTDRHGGQFNDYQDGGDCMLCHTLEGFIPSQFSYAQHNKSGFPLTGAHKAVPCNQCHKKKQGANGEYLTQFDFDNLTCRNCHTDVHRGQLNRWVEADGCTYCHTTESWNQVVFEHNQSRFPLEGRHREIVCLKCHYIKADQKGRIVWMKPLELTCNGCHEDVHQGQFAVNLAERTDCSRCHSPGGWIPAKGFDHNRDSRFALDGAHEKLQCNSCHTELPGANGKPFRKYKPLETECASCHSEPVKGRPHSGGQGS